MSKAFSKSLLLFYKFLVRRLKAIHATTTIAAPAPTTATAKQQQHQHQHRRAIPCSMDALPAAAAPVVVCKVEGGLLMSPSTFPYFMLVALEAGGLLRGLLLLLLYPLLCLLGHEAAVKAMAVVCFLGVRKDRFRLGRAVMPKLFLEDVNWEVFEVVRRSRRSVCVSGMPRVMVEGFLKEYLEVDGVVAPELRAFRGYYLGLMQAESQAAEVLGLEELAGVKDGGAVGIAGVGFSFHHLFQKYCQEVYVPTESERRRWRPLPSRRYPKPLIFHDGRIAFRPTPAVTLSMFVWLPLGTLLAVVRTTVFLLLPYALSIPLVALLGMHSRVIDLPAPLPPRSSGHVFACNHRTLLDPLYISAALCCNLTAVTYSISRVSELLAPIRTIRLTRDRAVDKAAMEAQLARGNLVVCPEGTTCREPFLLRFSPLFAELGRPVMPVALHSVVGMFYGTTAGGRKFLDPLYFLMNPVPCYIAQFLEVVATDFRHGGGAETSRDVANDVQRRIAKALGYQCTSLTRKDKYLILAGNEGVVEAKKTKKKGSHGNE